MPLSVYPFFQPSSGICNVNAFDASLSSCCVYVRGKYVAHNIEHASVSIPLVNYSKNNSSFCVSEIVVNESLWYDYLCTSRVLVQLMPNGLIDHSLRIVSEIDTKRYHLKSEKKPI